MRSAWPRWTFPAAIAALAIVACAIAAPPMLYADPATQILAAQQYAAGESSSPNHLAGPDEHDLSRAEERWIVWWPAGLPLLLAPLLSVGAPIGIGVRALSIACYAIGFLGWRRWIARFELSATWSAVTLLGYSLHHFATQPLVQFYTEAFVFAAVPWALVGTITIRDRPAKIGAGIGFVVGALVWLKYSLAFLLAGCAAFLWLLARRRSDLVRALSFSIGAAFAVSTVAITNRVLGGVTSSAASTVGLHLDPLAPLRAFSNFGAMLGGLQPVFDRLAWLYPELQFMSAATWLGIVPALLATAACLHFRARPEVALAGIVATAVCSCLVLVWTFSSASSHEPRHAAIGALACLPVLALAVQESRARLRSSGLKWVVAATVAGPIAAAAVALPAKFVRAVRAEATPQWLHNPLLASPDGSDATASLRASVNGCDVVVVPDPTTALDLPGVVRIAEQSEFMEPPAFARRFVATRPMRACVLSNPYLESTGRAALMRERFGHVDWTHESVDGTRLQLWKGTAFR